MNLPTSRIAAFLLTSGLALSGCVIHSTSGSSPQRPNSGTSKPAYQSQGSRPASTSEGRPVNTSKGRTTEPSGSGRPIDNDDPAPKRTGGATKDEDGPKRTSPKDGPKRTTPKGDPKRTTPKGDPKRTTPDADADNPKMDAGSTKAGKKKPPTSGAKKHNKSDTMVAPN